MTNTYGFEGKIGRYVKDSEPWFSTPAHPGEDAPNVIFVLLDGPPKSTKHLSVELVIVAEDCVLVPPVHYIS